MNDRDEFAVKLAECLRNAASESLRTGKHFAGEVFNELCSLLAEEQVAQPALADRLDTIAEAVREAWTPIYRESDNTAETGRAEQPDEWDREAEELLPCVDYQPPELHPRSCPAYYRPAVAAKLRELAHEHSLRDGCQRAEIARLTRERDEACVKLRKAIELMRPARGIARFIERLAYDPKVYDEVIDQLSAIARFVGEGGINSHCAVVI